MAKRPELLIETGELKGKRYTVTEAGLRLGRSSSNDLHVADEELSRNHCLFEPDGEEGIRVVDLASANGTYVNSVQLAADPKPLKPGDIVEAGGVRICIVAEGELPPPAASVSAVGSAVDLGLGAKPVVAAGGTPATGVASATKRSPLANVLWAVAALSVLSAIVVILMAPGGKRPSNRPSVDPSVVAKTGDLTSLFYEKVEADAARIFRYQMTVDAAGVLRVIYDDVPGENRHVDKSAKLSETALARIQEIFESAGWNELDEEYVGQDAETENALKRWCIRLVRDGKVKKVVVDNVFEPEAFMNVREALETFSRNELGIWALQYSRDKLIELSAESEKIADGKWEEREVEYGNLANAVKAYQEAVFYLETVNPKPTNYPNLKDKLRKAITELDNRYKEQRFRADRAINLGEWETAKEELRVLCDLVPEKSDPRHAEANSKLIDVETRIKNESGKKGGNR